MNNIRLFWHKALVITVLWLITLIPTFIILLFSSSYSSNYKLPTAAYPTNSFSDYFFKIGIYTMLYALFIVLIFLAVEYFYKKRIHPIQYLLVLLSLILFNLLCLSFTEFLPFWIAYIISSFLIISLITYYVSGFISLKLFPLKLSSFLIIIYSFLFVMIRFPEASVLIGSISFFILLASVMYFTRKIDFYDNKISSNSADNDAPISNS